MFQHLISQYGYLAVFVLMLAESACIPIPSEVVMMFGGALAAGAVPGAHPALFGVFVAGVFGNVAGSYVSWAVGKYAGQVAITRWGRRVGIREHEINKATEWFERHGPVAVLVGRVIPVIRTFISLPAGFADMPPTIFGLYTTLGAVPWTAALAILGYAVGANWDSVAKDFNGPTYAIAAILLVGIVVVIIRRRGAAAATASAPERSPAPASARPAPAPTRRSTPEPTAAYAPATHPTRRPQPQPPRPPSHAPRTPGRSPTPTAGKTTGTTNPPSTDKQASPPRVAGRPLRRFSYGPLTITAVCPPETMGCEITCKREH